MKASCLQQTLVVFCVLIRSNKTDGYCPLGEPEKYKSGDILGCGGNRTCSPFYRCYAISDGTKICCLDSYSIICKCSIISDIIVIDGLNASIQVTAGMATRLKLLGDNVTVDCRDAAMTVGQAHEAFVVVGFVENYKTHILNDKRITCEDIKSDCQQNFTFHNLPVDKETYIWITAITSSPYRCEPNSVQDLMSLVNRQVRSTSDSTITDSPSPASQNILQILLPSGLLILTVTSTTLIFICCCRCKRHTVPPPDMSYTEDEETPIISVSSKDVLIVSTPIDRPNYRTETFIKRLQQFKELKLFYPEKEPGCVAQNVDRWIHKTLKHCCTILVIMTKELVSGSEINSHPFYEVSNRLFHHVHDYISCKTTNLSKTVLFVFFDTPDETVCQFDIGIIHNSFILVGNNEIYNQNFRRLVEVLYNDINVDDKVVYLSNIFNSVDHFCNGHISKA